MIWAASIVARFRVPWARRSFACSSVSEKATRWSKAPIMAHRCRSRTETWSLSVFWRERVVLPMRVDVWWRVGVCDSLGSAFSRLKRDNTARGEVSVEVPECMIKLTGVEEVVHPCLRNTDHTFCAIPGCDVQHNRNITLSVCVHSMFHHPQ